MIPGLIHRATVYGENPTTGRYDVVVASALHCRLAHFVASPGATSAERVELAAMRNLMWDPSYVMPEGAQVEVTNYPQLAGRRWSVRSGTEQYRHGPDGAVVYGHATVWEQAT